jgi:phosphoribosylanthranilate isomerase
MTWIKICGITNLEDGLAAAEAGADALGFLFYEKSPRYVEPQATRKIIAELPDEIEKVGVFVDESWHEIKPTVETAQLTAIQFPARRLQEAGGWTKCDDVRIYVSAQALDPVKCQQEIDAIKGKGDIAAVFLDSGTSQQPGGTGKKFDWQLAQALASSIKKTGFPLVIAGGLTADNVGEALRVFGPWGVDVSSGVEAVAGKKDHRKLRDFIAAVRQAGRTI